ncbi:heavy-metal-associated domain-containing protein [Enterococcus sp. BWT-B8]|uniref:heavy-metal-associated domain-containing protein n=1 Tax=unclassified Enterococcus TaxID=2608891 RepID=UPI001E4B115B|nr:MULTISPECIES: heavy metal-associated domain-containing protein [unclassified Enterococcus]MCB5951595.1 heavy-metal-associated domain-containing protein [Enterococcus sp. BWT-B8]MCB5954687.1 heavy-metal-associated domain-containing protein [Enterococcus sp. CWB-B31]
MNQTVAIEGMKCDGCVGIVKEKFEAIPGVKAVDVQLDEKKATITADNEISKEQLQAALADTKFTVAG